MPYMKAPYGGTCVVCRHSYSKGDKVSSFGGFLRHLRCTPPLSK